MDKTSTWDKILKVIKDQVSPANFRTWFSQTTLGGMTESALTLNVPSAFIKTQLAARYEKLIISSAEQVLKKQGIGVTYTIDASQSPKTANQEGDELPFDLRSYTPTHIAPNPTLNLRFSMDNFVVGLTNNLAYAAAQAVIQNPGISYNPLFIYGPSGVGKTHLMHAIGNALAKKNPQLKLMYAPSERFIVDFVDSIQTKRTSEFRAKYRHCDLLMLDDIQFISGKDSMQEEFFHTFNELQSRNCQIVLTSDRTPNEIEKLEARLKSRFQGGLMVDIQLPDYETRMAILKAKLNEKGDSLPEEALSLIAETVQSNTRELEGKLVQILSLIKLTGQKPTMENIQKVLGKPQATTNGKLDPKKVLGSITKHFDLRLSELTGPKRQKELVLPRQIAMYILYENCRVPMERIGQMIGGRDHTTILYGIEKIRAAIKRDREIQRLVVEVQQALTAT